MHFGPVRAAIMAAEDGLGIGKELGMRQLGGLMNRDGHRGAARSGTDENIIGCLCPVLDGPGDAGVLATH